MRADEIIARVDALEPNQYDVPTKLAWLSDLDGKLFAEVILTHEDIPAGLLRRAITDGATGQPVLPPYTAGSEETIAGPPYGMDLYSYYLMAMIALQNAEASKYNARMISYNAAYQDWANWYNRTHMPLRAGKRFLF